jgi:hypothetical protein
MLNWALRDAAHVRVTDPEPISATRGSTIFSDHEIVGLARADDGMVVKDA